MKFSMITDSLSSALNLGQTQQTPNSLLNRLAAILHQEPDGGGCRVELGDLIFINDLPHPAHIRVCGKTLKLGTDLKNILYNNKGQRRGVNILSIT